MSNCKICNEPVTAGLVVHSACFSADNRIVVTAKHKEQLLQMLLFKTKYLDYFRVFTGHDLGAPVIMTSEESLIRLLLEIFDFKSREDIEKELEVLQHG